MVLGAKWPKEGKTAAEGGYWQVGHIVAGELQWRLASDSALGAVGEGHEPIELLAAAQMACRGHSYGYRVGWIVSAHQCVT